MTIFQGCEKTGSSFGRQSIGSERKCFPCSSANLLEERFFQLSLTYCGLPDQLFLDILDWEELKLHPLQLSGQRLGSHAGKNEQHRWS